MSHHAENLVSLSTIDAHAQYIPNYMGLKFEHCSAEECEESDGLRDRVLVHCALTHQSPLDFLVFHYLAEYDLRIGSAPGFIASHIRRGECLLLGGSYVPVGVDDPKRAIPESIARLIDQGLIRQGVPELPPPDESVLELWTDPWVEFNENSLCLSAKGKQVYLQLEPGLLERSIWGMRNIDGLVCWISTGLHVLSHDCPMGDFNRACPIFKPDQTGGCRLGYVPRWRPQWWRDPVPGYVVLCTKTDPMEGRWR